MTITYYKDLGGDIFGFDETQTDIIPLDYVELTQQEEDELLDPSLTLAGSIALKQQEVRAHYETLHGESLASVVKRQAAVSPSVVTTANAITNIAIADGGIAAIAALIDKATVDAYSVVGLAWS